MYESGKIIAFAGTGGELDVKQVLDIIAFSFLKRALWNIEATYTINHYAPYARICN